MVATTNPDTPDRVSPAGSNSRAGRKPQYPDSEPPEQRSGHSSEDERRFYEEYQQRPGQIDEPER